jgi:antitoxin VapB
MSQSGIGKLFQNGRSQAVRLPRAFRFAGDRVRLRRIGNGVLIEPLGGDPAAWFAAMDAHGTEPILPRGRKQPRAPKRKMFP